MSNFILAIVGSRSYTNYQEFKIKLEEFLGSRRPDQIVSGGATGVDSMAERYAKENEIALIVFPADWKRYGRAAGPIRNREIVNACTEVIAFPKGPTPIGTYSTIKIAKQAKKKVTVIDVE